MKKRTAGIVLATMALCASMSIGAAGDAERGRAAFDKRCTGCHSLDKIKFGPPLRDAYGRKAGKAPQFPYSEAMKNTSVTWDEMTLDRWLTDTESVIPDNEMAFRLNDPVERSNIIAYLKHLQASSATHTPALFPSDR